MENEKLYINAPHLVDLVECMEKMAKNNDQKEAFGEVIDLIYDIPWKEVK